MKKSEWLLAITLGVPLGLLFLAFNMGAKSIWSGWLMALALVIFCLPFFWIAVRHFGLKQTQQTRRPEDISDEHATPSPKVIPITERLTELGFVRLGETRTPVRGNKSIVTWVLVSPDHSETAEIFDFDNDSPAVLQFNTVFIDDAFLLTDYPTGENSDFPLLRTRFNPVNVAAAYRQHINERSAMELTHSFARPVGSMEEFLKWDSHLREHHLNDRFRHSTFKWRMVSLTCIVFIAFMVSGASIPYKYHYEKWVQVYLLTGTAILGVMAFITLVALIPRHERMIIRNMFRRRPKKTYWNG